MLPEGLCNQTATLWTRPAQFERETLTSQIDVLSGSGATDDNGVLTGLGNLIVGYAEDLGNNAARTGSHNLVLGEENSWTSYAGGWNNSANATSSAILGGYGNYADGTTSTISGGYTSGTSGQYGQRGARRRYCHEAT